MPRGMGILPMPEPPKGRPKAVLQTGLGDVLLLMLLLIPPIFSETPPVVTLPKPPPYSMRPTAELTGRSVESGKQSY